MGSSDLTEPLLGIQTAQSPVRSNPGTSRNSIALSWSDGSEAETDVSPSLRKIQSSTREASMAPSDELSQSKKASSVGDASSSADSQDALQRSPVSPTIDDADEQPWR